MQWFGLALIFGGIFATAAATRGEGAGRWEMLAAGVMAIVAGLLVLVIDSSR
jgi:uncharacterized membrane protein HdeD (DUF308 family)